MKKGDNPEDRLIGLLAAQVEEDEKLIDALGAGVLELEDVERWLERRRDGERRFLDEASGLIGRMRAEGFSRQMNRTRVRHARAYDRAAWNQ